MMTRPRKTLIAAMVGAACTAASAQGIMDWNYAKRNICGSYQVLFVNGIDNDSAEAQGNMRLLTAYGNVFKSHPMTYILLYNQTRGIPIDFYQSVLQVLKGYQGATWTNFYNAVQSTIYASGMTPALTATISKTVDDLFALTKPSPYHDQDLEFMRVVMLSAINKYSRAVFVGHSQGNLYINQLVTLAQNAGISLNAIGVVGVAVPYNSTRTGNLWVTSANDLVIDSVRKAVANIPAMPQPLAANVTIPYNFTNDPLGHSFASYMGDATARGKIFAGITSEMSGRRTTAPIGTQYNNMDTSGSSIGQAGWMDCTSEPGGTPPNQYTNHAPPTLPSGCWNRWFVPVVSSAPAGNYSSTTRPGDPGTVPSLAAAQANGCVALGAAAWKAWVALNDPIYGTLPGSPGNCGSGQYGDTNMRLAGSYNLLMSGDAGTKQTTSSWKDSYYTMGGTIVRIDPVCRN